MKPRVMVFCKAPVPGEVKTRLMPEYSGEEAAEIHRQLAHETLEDGLLLKDVALELWCAPDDNHELFQEYQAKGYSLHVQSGADLGERMSNAFAWNPKPGILIGTDCPTIDAAYLQQSLFALKNNDVVLAPAEDGGYGLIGLHGPKPELFQGITWSTDTVLSSTLKKCESAGLKVEQLPQIWDVDHPEDVARWRDMFAARAQN